MKTTKLIFTFLSVTVVVSFFSALKISQNDHQQVKGRMVNNNIKGITLPHHELASEIIINALENLSETYDYKNIVLISPNHFYPESYTFTTEQKTNDHLSNIATNIDAEFPHLIVDDNRVQKEHGVQNVKSFLSEYYPNANYYMMLTSLRYEPEELVRMANHLSEINEDTLYVLSVDFAHGYTQEQALINNQESIDALSNFEYQKILSFDDAHMDAPVGTALFLKIMEQLNSTKWATIYNSHTGILTQDPTLQGTGYVIGVFSQK